VWRDSSSWHCYDLKVSFLYANIYQRKIKINKNALNLNHTPNTQLLFTMLPFNCFSGLLWLGTILLDVFQVWAHSISILFHKHFQLKWSKQYQNLLNSADNFGVQFSIVFLKQPQKYSVIFNPNSSSSLISKMLSEMLTPMHYSLVNFVKCRTSINSVSTDY
jgi:hypothetical protein